MENDFRGLEDLIKNVVQESDCPFSHFAFGHIDADALVQIERCLALFLGIAK
jgi:hypothetical protein